jgi:3,4-dihydroxy-2-butanone 4-phosphate synthase
MRYLRLAVDRTGLPKAEELHIVTSWVLERIRDGGSVLIHDTDERGNDGLIACAVMVKDGVSADKAQSRLRGVSHVVLAAPQLELLHQFMAQRAVASGRG